MNLDSYVAWFGHILDRMDLASWLVACVNLVLLIFARRIVQLVYHEDENSSSFKLKLSVFRALNLLIIISFGYFHFYMPSEEKGVGLKLLAILVICYLGYLCGHLSNYLIIRRYGKVREIKGETKRVETYNTRLLNIFTQVFVFVIVLISVVRLLGFDTLLEAGGVIGFVGVFLALTNAVWAPDMFSGLIILNSDMIAEGDVVKFNDGSEIYGTVYKTKVFHTEILDLIGNHRVMVKNSNLRNYTVHNLSKFASAKGLRQQLCFKIGYMEEAEQVLKMLRTACDKAIASKEVEIQKHTEMEIEVNDTGDHAVEWVVSFYTKKVDQLPRLRRQLLAIFLETSIEAGISLATPLIQELTLLRSNEIAS